MKKEILLGIALFASSLCFAQTNTIDTKSFIFNDINKSEKPNSSLSLETIKAAKVEARATEETAERLDSLVGKVAGTGVVNSKEMWYYNEKNFVTEYRKYSLEYVFDGTSNRQMLIELERSEYEYDSNGYIIKENKRALLNPFTNLYIEGIQNRYAVDTNGNVTEQYIDTCDINTGAWNKVTYTQYRLDETNKDSVFLEGIVSIWNDSFQEYGIQGKSERVFDDHGNLIVNANYYYQDGKWVGYERGRTDHRYNYTTEKEEDIISMEKNYNWDQVNGVWVPFVATYITFNSLGNVTSTNEYTYVSANDSTHTKRETLTYLDMDGLAKGFYLVSDVIEWFSTEKNEFVWRMKDEYTYSFSNDTIYSYGTRTEHVVGRWETINNVATFVWSPSSSWRTEEIHRIWIDYVGKNRIHLKEYAYATGIWQSGGKYLFSHDEKGREIEWIEYQEIDYDQWVPAGKITIEFNDDDLVLSTTSFAYENGEWVYGGGTEHEYDEAKVRILSLTYTSNWMTGNVVGSRGTKYTFDYGTPVSQIIYPSAGYQYKLLTIEELSYDAEGWYTSKEYIAYYTEVAKYSSTPSLSIGNASAYILNDVLYVDSAIAETIGVYSTTGSLVFSAQKAEGMATFSLTNLPTGVYVVKGENWVIKGIK